MYIIIKQAGWYNEQPRTQTNISMQSLHLANTYWNSLTNTMKSHGTQHSFKKDLGAYYSNRY